METRVLAGVVATAVVFSIGAAAPAAAEGNSQVVGIEQTVGDPNDTEIAYTVSKIFPSADPVAYPVAGQLYEATVMARALQGTVVPSVPSFSAHAGSGATYPALASVSGLSGAPLWDGATTEGKIYFDVVGDVPDSVVFSDGPVNLAWALPVAGGSAGGSGVGSAGGQGGSGGTTGSTGPNDVSPQTSGGEIGGGEGGTEGGGGNLSSGGGSGAPNGDTGGGGSGG
jgi:Domain of unknown function (DUF1942)